MSRRNLRRDEAGEGVAAADVVPADAIVLAASKCGYLHKRSGNGFVQNWKRRFCVLYGTLLYYYDSEVAPAPRGILQLDGATVIYGARAPRAPRARGLDHASIQIRTRADRVFYLRDVASEYETRAWYELLAAVPNVVAVDEVAARADETSMGSTIAPSEPSPSDAAAATDGGDDDSHTHTHTHEATMVMDMPEGGQTNGTPNTSEDTPVASSGPTMIVLPPAPGMSLSAGVHTSTDAHEGGAWVAGQVVARESEPSQALAAMVARFPAELQLEFTFLLSRADHAQEVQRENAAIKSQLQGLIKARAEALQVASRDQATIASLTRSLEAAQTALASHGGDTAVVDAIAAEQRRAEERVRTLEQEFQRRLNSTVATVDAEVDQRIADELRDVMAEFEAGTVSDADETLSASAQLARKFLQSLQKSGGGTKEKPAENMADARNAVMSATVRAEEAAAAAAVAQAALVAAEGRVLEIHQQLAAVMSLSDPDGLRAALGAAMESRDTAVAALSAANEQRDAAVAHVSRLRAQLDSLTAQASALSADLQVLREENAELRAAVAAPTATSEERAQQLQRIVAAVSADNEALRGEMLEHLAVHQQLQVQMRALQGRTQELERKLLTADARYAALSAQLARKL